VFNVLNSNTVLQRQLRASIDSSGAVKGSGSVAGEIFEIQAPRTLRFGARLSF
jgi:hypothetical protein